MENGGYKFYKPITMIKENENVIDRKKTARIAGSLYLLLAVTGFLICDMCLQN
jgi:hypothetical protein